MKEKKSGGRKGEGLEIRSTTLFTGYEEATGGGGRFEIAAYGACLGIEASDRYAVRGRSRDARWHYSRPSAW
jgi:hypothetical protein